MRWLLFLSRVAFICGIFFLLSASLLIRDWAADQAVVSTMIIIGQVIGVVLVPFVCLMYLVVLFWKRTLRGIVPFWLVISNLLFLVILGLYIYLQYG